MFSRRDFCVRSLCGAVLAASPLAHAAKHGAPMLTRPIPAAKNERLPVIGMGTWNTFDVGSTPADRAPLAKVLDAFFASEARIIDTSPMYGNAEAVTGDLLKQSDRHHATFLATKVWTSGRDNGQEQIEQSMRLLKTPRLDLLQIHNLVDWRTHLPTMRSLQAQDKVRYLGITHYTVQAHAELEAALTAEKFDFVQFNYSMGERAAEERLLPLCQERGIAVLINRPFEEGALFTAVGTRKLPAYAREIGCSSWAQFFLKFIVSHPAVTAVIPATSRVNHMMDNLKAGVGPMPDAAMRERMAKELT
jgi:diketogulonate reductase-like aldo/keto reductase